MQGELRNTNKTIITQKSLVLGLRRVMVSFLIFIFAFSPYGFHGLGLIDWSDLDFSRVAFGENSAVAALPAPGGLDTDLTLWLKANEGGQSWTDQSDASASVVRVGIANVDVPLGLNFNPTIEFVEQNYYQTDLSIDRDTVPNTTMYAVAKKGSGEPVSNGTIISASFDDDHRTVLTNSASAGTSFFYSNPGDGESFDVFGAHFETDTTDGSSIRLNGENVFTFTDSAGVAGNLRIGDKQETTSSAFSNGEMAEVIMYNAEHSEAEAVRIESYLALKYGLTLDQAAGGYADASGNPVYTYDGTFDYNVLGLARDIDSSIDQQIATSANTGTILTVSSDTDFTLANDSHTSLSDGQYLVMANDNSGLGSQTSDLDTIKYIDRIQREWRVENTGNVGAINLKFDGFGNEYMLVGDLDGNFTTTADQTRYGALSPVGEIYNVSFSDGEHFTIATPTPSSPGGVDDGLRLWLRADRGATPTQWDDRSGNDLHATVGAGSFSIVNGAMNFNPAYDFNGASYMKTLSTDLGDTVSAFLVQDARALASQPFDHGEDFGVAATGTYGFGGTVTAYPDNSLHSDPVVRSLIVTQNAGGLVDQNGQEDVLSGGLLSSGFIPFGIGARGSDTSFGLEGSAGYDGVIAETIAYNGDVDTGSQLTQIQSYLALKYGITLDPSISTYKGSAGGDVYAYDGTYDHDIVGIVNDSISDFDQQISHSVNADAILTLSTDANFTSVNGAHASLTDQQYFVVGHNGLGTGITKDEAQTSWSASLPDPYTQKTLREWKVSNVGGVSGVSMKFEGFDDQWRLIKDDDDDFSESGVPDAYAAQDLGALNTNGEIHDITIEDGWYFTLVRKGVYYTIDATSVSSSVESSPIDPKLQIAGGMLDADATISFDILTGSLATFHNQTATPGVDFTPASGTVSLTIPAGDYTTPQVIDIDLIDVQDDQSVEGSETIVYFPSGTTGTILAGDGNADDIADTFFFSYTIIDDDITSTGITKIQDGAEDGVGASADVIYEVRVVPTNDTGSAISGTLTFTGSATEGTDYDTGPTNFSIPDGDSVAQVTLPVVEDVLVEGVETITATISNLSFGDIYSASEDATITDDDFLAAISPVNIASDNANTDLARSGDEITVLFTSDLDLQNVTASIAGQTAVVSGGSQSWTATLLLVGTEPEGIASLQIDGETLTGAPITQVSGTTDGSDVTIDFTAPTNPVNAPDLNPSSDTGVSDTDDETSDTTPTIDITCADGNTVDLYSDNPVTDTLIGSALCAGGSASITPNLPLVEGDYNFHSKETDPAGNKSGSSQTLGIVVIDTTGPSAPPIDTPEPAGQTGGKVSGSGALPNALIAVSDGAGASCTVTADASGNWSCDLTPIPADGSTPTISATQTDPAGNVSPATEVPTTVDTVAPAEPTIDTPTNGDPVTGAGEPEAEVTITTQLGSTCATIVLANGTYSCTLSPLPSDGEDITAQQADPAGNTSPEEVGLNAVDTVPPTTPTLTAPTNGDPVSGTADPDTVVIVETPSGATCTVDPVPASGEYECTLVPAPTEGEDVTVTSQDPAGNTASVTEGAGIDVTVPTTPATPNLDAVADTGDSDTDDVTGDNTPSFGTDTPITCADGNMVTMYSDNPSADTIIGQEVCALGVVIITTNLIPDGIHNVTLTESDPAGNMSSPSGALPITVTTDAAPAPAVPDLQAGSDTGSSDTDDTTADNTPSFDVVCSVAGHTMTLYSNLSITNAPIGSHVCVGTGPEQIDVLIALPDDTHDVTLTETDPAGNSSTPSSALPVVVDTAAPTDPLVAPDLNATSDTGTSDSDDETSDTTPTIDITCTDGNTVSLYSDNPSADTLVGTELCAGGVVSVTSNPPLAQGDYNFHNTETDPAGNASDDSPILGIIVIDTTSPDAPPIDFPIPSGTTDGTVSGSGAVPDNEIIITAGAGASCTVTADASGNWSCDLTPIPADGSTPTISATQTDPAGNVSPATEVPTTVDTVAPAEPTIDTPTNGDPVTGTGEIGAEVTVTTQLGSTCTTTVGAVGVYACVLSPTPTEGEDVEVVQVDGAGNESDPEVVLNVVDVTAPEDPTIAIPTNGDPVVGTADPGTAVTVTTSGGSSCTVNPVPGNGEFSCTLSPAPTEGENVVVTSEDEAGNVATISEGGATDTTVPATPSTPDLVVASDTGQEDDDDLTADVMPEFDVSCSEAGATTTLYSDNPSAGRVIAQQVCTSPGTYPIQTTSPLDEGLHEITAIETDPAGNTSPVSPGLQIEVDTVAPAMPAILDLDAADDTGKSDFDNITSETEATFGNDSTIACTEGNIVTLYSDAPTLDTIVAVTTCGISGEVTLTTNPLVEGSQKLTLLESDLAGNASTPSPMLDVEIDSTPPVSTPPPAAPVDDADVNNPTVVSGTCTDAEGGQAVLTTTPGSGLNPDPTVLAVDGSGGYQGTLGWAALSHGGTFDLVVTCEDIAGNSAPASTVSDIAVDLTDPGDPSIDFPVDGGDTDGTVSGSGSTPGDTVTVVVAGGAQTCSTTVQSDGSWNCDLSPTPAEGPVQINVIVTDPSGNESGVVSVEPEVDTQDPVAPTIDTPSNGAPVTGTGEVGAEVTLTTPSGATCIAIVASDGTYACVLSPTPAEGEDITAVQTDEAGNESDPLTAQDIIDIAPPSTPTINTPTNGDPVTGTAEPGSAVVVTTPSGASCSVDPVPISGEFSCEITPTPMDGEDITVAVTDPAGNTVEQTEPGAAQTINPLEPETGFPAEGEATDGTVGGEAAAPGTTIVVEVTEGSGIGSSCEAIVQSDGSWSCDLSPTPPEGTVTLEIVAQDDAGNESDPVTMSAVIDGTDPVEPTLNTPTNGDPVTGTAEPGSAVVVTTPSGAACTVDPVPVTGEFTCSLSSTPRHDEDIVVTSTDPAGNTAEITEDGATDTEQPPMPFVNSPLENAAALGPVISIGASCSELGDTIRVSEESAVPNPTVHVCTGPGAVSIPVETTTVGPTEFDVTTTDPAGNTSDPTVRTVSVGTPSDADGDGVPNSEENVGINAGDGNGDGILDITQPNVSSKRNPVTGAPVTLETSGSSCQLVSGFDIITESKTVPDNTYDYPLGLQDYKLYCSDIGETADISVYFDQTYDTTLWTWRKFDAVGAAYATIPSVSYSTTVIGGTPVIKATYSVTDGGPLDEDGVANGVILDPSGPGTIAPNATDPTPDPDPTSPTEDPSPVYRFWSETYKVHFYTISESERDSVIADYDDSIWRFEELHTMPSILQALIASQRTGTGVKSTEHTFTRSVKVKKHR